MPLFNNDKGHRQTNRNPTLHCTQIYLLGGGKEYEAGWFIKSMSTSALLLSLQYVLCGLICFVSLAWTSALPPQKRWTNWSDTTAGCEVRVYRKLFKHTSRLDGKDVPKKDRWLEICPQTINHFFSNVTDHIRSKGYTDRSLLFLERDLTGNQWRYIDLSPKLSIFSQSITPLNVPWSGRDFYQTVSNQLTVEDFVGQSHTHQSENVWLLFIDVSKGDNGRSLSHVSCFFHRKSPTTYLLKLHCHEWAMAA